MSSMHPHGSSRAETKGSHQSMREHTRAPDLLHMVAEPCASAEMAHEDDANELNGRWVTVTGSHPSRVRGKVDSDPGEEAVIHDVWQIIENLREELQRLEEETRRKFTRVNRVLTHLALSGQEHVQNCTVEQIIDVPVATQCQVSTIPTTQRTVEMPQVQSLDRMDGVPVVMRRQTAQTIEVPQCQVPKTVSQDRIPQRIDEQLVDIPVPQIAEEIVEMFNVFTQDRVQQRTVEQSTETSAISLSDEIVETPKTQTQKEVISCMKEDQSEFSEIEMHRQVQKTVEVPQIQFIDKTVDVPVVVQRQVSAEPLQSITAALDLKFSDRLACASHKSFEVAKRIPHERRLNHTAGRDTGAERVKCTHEGPHDDDDCDHGRTDGRTDQDKRSRHTDTLIRDASKQSSKAARRGA